MKSSNQRVSQHPKGSSTGRADPRVESQARKHEPLVCVCCLCFSHFPFFPPADSYLFYMLPLSLRPLVLSSSRPCPACPVLLFCLANLGVCRLLLLAATRFSASNIQVPSSPRAISSSPPSPVTPPTRHLAMNHQWCASCVHWIVLRSTPSCTSSHSGLISRSRSTFRRSRSMV